MSFLSIKNVSKSFGMGAARRPALSGINLEIAEEEFVAVIGFSGSGKTTLVSMLAGLLNPDEGEILLKGRAIDGPEAGRGMVFQNYSLLPWLTVEGNVLLAAAAAHHDWDAGRQRAHAQAWLAKVHLTPALHKRPRQLSGGMRQRVALARALATDPEILLMDEPFGALDALTRATLQDEVEALWRRERKTALLITNDVDEALLMADRIITLTPGPGATVASEYRAGLARPRDRKALNHDPEYRRLRNEITRGLIELSRGRTRTMPASIQAAA